MLFLEENNTKTLLIYKRNILIQIDSIIYTFLCSMI